MKFIPKEKQLNSKGFTLVELAVILAVLAVLIAVLAPSLLKYVENSRMQKDESAMDEVCNAVQLAIADSEIFDEVCAYAVPNNYVTYSDSSGTYGAKYSDEEYWAPDGSGHALTITFNPDDNGTYNIAEGQVNNMTYGNGSVADTRVVEGVKQCSLEDMGQAKLYSKLKQTIGTSFNEKSATYKNSAYTVFIKLNNMNGIKQADVYGEFNGTNLSPDSPAAIGSGTSEYTPEGDAVVTKPNGGTQTPQYSNSDLSGGGSVGGNTPSVLPDSEEESSTTTLRFGKPYCLETYNNGTYTIHYAYVFFANGSASYNILLNGSIYQSETAPAGTLIYDEDSILFAEDETEIVGNILNNGQQVEIDGQVYTLGLINFCVHEHTEVRETTDRYTGNTYCSDCDALIEKGEFIVTAADIANGVYLVGVKDTNTGDYTGATAMYKAGEALPAPQNGDVYVKGDYEYRYNYRWNVNVDKWESNWRNLGWGVRVLDDTKVSYDKILSTVNGQPVGLLFDTYFACENMVYAPELPETAKELCGTFGNCTSLKESPVIPEGVIFLGNVYQFCKSMTVVPEVPDSVEDIQSYLFYGCNALTGTLSVPCTAVIGYNTEAYSISTEVRHVSGCSCEP